MKTVKNVLTALLAPVLFFYWTEIFNIPDWIIFPLFVTAGVGMILGGLVTVARSHQSTTGDELVRRCNRGIGYLYLACGSFMLTMLSVSRHHLLILEPGAYAPYLGVLAVVGTLALITAFLALVAQAMRNGSNSICKRAVSCGVLFCAVFLATWPGVITVSENPHPLLILGAFALAIVPPTMGCALATSSRAVS